MTMSRDQKNISARISLAILALGFSLLEILSFINRPEGDSAIATALANNCCVVGSLVSMLAGSVFLIAACISWGR
jgi:hypothetical protein